MASILGGCTKERMADECRAEYRAYHRALRDRHIRWSADGEGRRNDKQAFVAVSLDAALPSRWGARLAGLIPEAARHQHYLSAGSSQTLALALIGPAVQRKDDLPWLLGPDGLFPSLGEPVHRGFERSVGFALLNESPHTTDFDFLASGPLGVLGVEAKFTEEGLGGCRCPGRRDGRCEQRVLDRPYWRVARDYFGLEGPEIGRPCELGLAYQAVRNVAAVVEMTGLRGTAAFGLLYDQRNPYFAGAGEWPGWSSVLTALLPDTGGVFFRAISWQELIPRLPSRGRSEVLAWARDKHDLP